jgi:hypothetical protein
MPEPATTTSRNFGDDIINGGDSDDVLVGARGDDTIDGGAGNDLIWGGFEDFASRRSWSRTTSRKIKDGMTPNW